MFWFVGAFMTWAVAAIGRTVRNESASAPTNAKLTVASRQPREAAGSTRNSGSSSTRTRRSSSDGRCQSARAAVANAPGLLPTDDLAQPTKVSAYARRPSP